MQVRHSTFGTTAMVPLSNSSLRRRDDLAVTALINSYGERGGLASPEEIIIQMRPYWRQPVSILSKWIVSRKVVSFSWRTRMLLPIFQFECARITPNQAIADCSLELGDLMDDEGFASWFVHPCDCLAHRMPVDMIFDEPDAVVDAAGRTRVELMARRLAS